MKKMILEFFQRGLIACGFGPLVLVVLYQIFHHKYNLETLTVDEICLGIVSLSILAFIAGGINIIYQIERLPLMAAIFIHGSVLYVSYLVTYLANDWLEKGTFFILSFTGIFLLIYLVIWVFIYFATRRNAKKMNELLKKTQQTK